MVSLVRCWLQSVLIQRTPDTVTCTDWQLRVCLELRVADAAERGDRGAAAGGDERDARAGLGRCAAELLRPAQRHPRRLRGARAPALRGPAGHRLHELPGNRKTIGTHKV